jgi:hypothetical protein
MKFPTASRTLTQAELLLRTQQWIVFRDSLKKEQRKSRHPDECAHLIDLCNKHLKDLLCLP